MQSSFASWKRQQGSSKGATSYPAAVTSRVGMAATVEPPPSDGVYSYNQMKRVTTARSHRPPSEVGTIRSVRSVMTVEEQMGEMERKMDDVLSEQQATREALAAILQKLEALGSPSSAPSRAPTSKK